MKYGRIAAALALVCALTLAIYTVGNNVSSAPDFPTRQILATDPEITVEIPSGASGSDIGALLLKEEVIKSSLAYFRIAVADKRSQKVSPGAHRLNREISALQALEQLLDPARIPNLLKIFEGEWKSEIVDSLITYGFSSAQISNAFKSVALPDGFTSAEGLLFPAQYSFPSGTNAGKVLQSLIDRFQQEQAGREILAGRGDFSALALLTIASIVQAEGNVADFGKIARVIYNRLKISMPLQMDSTINYAKKARGSIFVSTNATQIKSPYNTYKRYGLPPTPIGNPGADAMRATLNPPPGDWLYFITVAPGDTRFSTSHDEFLQWKSLYPKNRKAGAFE